MKHISESIIGRKGSGFRNYKGYLSYGDIVRVSNGALLMYMEENDARRFAALPVSAFVSVEYAIIAADYDDMLRENIPHSNKKWDITHIFKTSRRFPTIKAYRQEELEEIVKNCGTCITILKNIK